MALPPRLRSAVLGERGLRFEVMGSATVLARAAQAIAASDATLDAAGGSSTLVVVASSPIDPLRRAAITTSVASALAAASATRVTPRDHEIDVVYDGEDLPPIAAAAGLSVEEAAELHARTEYTVELGGFLPGFAYLGEVPEPLRTPRRQQPRARVPAGSVALADRQTGIYPTASPGGWNLVGRAASGAPWFDPEREQPARFAIGDRVRFRPVPGAPAREAPPHLPDDASGALVVERVAGLVTVQDAGRGRWLHAGVPASGALDPVALAAANLAVGNDPVAAGLEVAMGGARFVVRSDVLASIDGEAPQRLLAGDAIEVPASSRLASYVAIRGGIDVPLVLGTRSTAVAASLGGLQGRALRRGDVLAVGVDPGTPLPDRPRLVVPASSVETLLRIDVIPPHGVLDATSVEALLAQTFIVSARLDRVGVRLEGGTIPRAEDRHAKPEPVVPGSVQIATDGTPMILGPDAAITGGYPVIGVVRKTSLWALYRLRPGARVRFARAVA